MANKPKHMKPTHDDVKTAEKIYNEGKRAAEAELKQMREQFELERANIEVITKIRMKDADAAQAKFLQVMFLRETKERLKKDGTWTDFCRKSGIDLKNADYEISKLGELKDEFLLKFGAVIGFEINKIKYIAGGDSERLGVEVKGKDLYYQGEKVPLSEAPSIISAIHDELRKERDEAAAGKRAMQRVLKQKEALILKQAGELDRFSGRARAKDLTPEEEGFLSQMETLKIGFDGYMLQADPARIEELQAGDGAAVTPRMRAAYLETLGYMRRQVIAAYDTAVEMYGHDMSPDEGWTPKS